MTRDFTKQSKYALSTLRALLVIGVAGAAGCGSLISGAATDFAGNLAEAVVNQPDPGIVRDGIPSYLLLLDSFLEGDPDNQQLLGAAAEMYAAYAAVFVDEPIRAKRLSSRARDYAARGLCLSYESACEWGAIDYDVFEQSLAATKPEHADGLYSYALASLAYVRAHSDDWNALANLPQMEAMLVRLREIDSGDREASLLTYLGIMLTLRPAGLGGEPERAKGFFEQALALSDGQDLAIKLELARAYARPLYLRELHDQLLNDVVGSDPIVDGYTLTNTLAQAEAAKLLASADDYF